MTKTFALSGIPSFLLAVLAVSAILAVPASDLAWAASRDARWKQVEEANRKGLPKTAVARLEPIIATALKNRAYGEAVKAIGLKIALESSIEGNKPEAKIIRMQAETAKAPEEMKPVMEAILANWYWQYFKQNRYRFLKRTRTAEPPGEDFTTWDLPRILREIDKQFDKALAHDRLKTTPVSAYDDLLEKGTAPDAWRPTMFDFLAFNALDFYTAAEQGAVTAEDAFELSADSPIFGTVDEFLAWKPATDDARSPTLRAVRLYQEILAFHRGDRDRAAFMDADLWRLHFGWNKAFGEEKNERYKAALRRLVNEWPNHEITALALNELAKVLNGEGNLPEAHNTAKRGAEAFPDSAGGRMCFNLVQQLRAKSAAISTERVWNEPMPSIQVTYRNVSKVFFRLVPYDFDEVVASSQWRMTGLDRDRQKQLLAAKPAQAWAADLPPTADFRERVEKLPAPGGLKPGPYFLLASHDPSFGESDNQVSFTQIWVSDLALVMRTRSFEGTTEGFVLNAVTGEPIAGATVRAWMRNKSSGRYEPVDPTRTDENGLFRFNLKNESCVFLAERGTQRLATGREWWAYVSQREPVPSAQTVFFTDRSLYRPGQTIQYKGICFVVDQAGNRYKTVAGQALTVLFQDPNRREIGRQQVTTNDFGSFSGSFTAPREALTGKMAILVQAGAPGSTSINVEEYKRPKFQVELAAPKKAAKLNAEVGVTGKALAYTGSPIGGAGVKYRVEREVRFPVWCRWVPWFLPPGREQAQAIAHGSTVTQNDGSFTVTFTARPDPAAKEKDEPVFEFTVYADVTDTTGETRSTRRSVRVGFTALQAVMTAAEWQAADRPVELAVDAKTLDGEGQAAAGTIKVYALKQPDGVLRPDLQPAYRPRAGVPVTASGGGREKADPSDPNSWELGEVVSEQAFRTDEGGSVKVPVALGPGVYRVMLDTTDRFGKTVTARLPIEVVDLKAQRFGVKVANHFAAAKWSVEPGEAWTALWGTGYDKGRAFVEIEHRGKTLRSFWTGADRTQETIEHPVGEDLRGGFTARVTYVRENRAYISERIVDVPWTNKKLTVKWERFNSKLGPSQKETWTAVVTGPDTKRTVAEMVAGLYDASLDAYLPHRWIEAFGVFRRETSRVQTAFENQMQSLQQIFYGWQLRPKEVRLTYRTFPSGILSYTLGARYYELGTSGVRGGTRSPARKAKAGAPSAAPAGRAATMAEDASPSPAPPAESEPPAPATSAERPAEGPKGPGPDLGEVSARRNLNETAFFFPRLLADADGTVKIEFTMPEALTEWKFMGFAHDRELRSGFLADKVVTSKDLMVEPNPPRFVREGDTIEFTVKISNRTAAQQTGRVKLTFCDARTLQPVDAQLANEAGEQAFDLPPRESRSFAWRVTVPDGMGFLSYKAVGATDLLSDGEEGYLPVLSRRVLVTESFPLPVRGRQTKELAFTKLLESGKSATLQHQSLTVQMVSQPAWYAVMALPYMMEFPYECTEQTFNRLYANALARHIANSDPKIRRVFDLWKDTPALDSPLEKNRDLKAVTIEETPWLQQAQNESRARKNVGILFDGNRLDDETRLNLKKLAQQQLEQGAWPWFPGGPPNDYITLYITTGFGRLRHLGVNIDTACAIKALGRLDGWIDTVYRDILRNLRKDDNHLTSTVALYLYGRSFFLKDRPIPGSSREAVDYFLGQAGKHWLQLSSRQSQAHLAVALKRFGNRETATAIMRSLKERSVSSEELGMSWSDSGPSWWWYRAPIETQAMMIEAFDEVMNDAQAVEDCKVWLLKQKQTSDWKTTKATADAVYALMLRGSGMLGSDALVEVSLGGVPIRPEKVEAGTGFYEKRFTRDEIRPEFGNITVTKTDEGVSWGGVHWQYLEDVARVAPYEGTPLKLKKTLFTKVATSKGQELKPVAGALAVGDELVVRIELRVDRDMEYVHLKDQRGSGTEPVSVLSRYNFREGLSYYESTRDTATHFFIDHLPKGVYVFEYSTRIQLKGRYQTGVAAIQCMYAPEFNSHSESFELEVR